MTNNSKAGRYMLGHLMTMFCARASMTILPKPEHIVGWVQFMTVEEMKNSF